MAGGKFLKEERREDFKKYFFWATIILLLGLAYLILRNYIVALISAFILAYLMRPVFVNMRERIGKSAAAIVSIVIVLIVIIVPMALVFGRVVQQSYHYLSENELSEVIEGIFEGLNLEDYNAEFDRIVEMGVDYFAGFLGSSLRSLPSLAISIFVALFGMYYILVDWERLSVKLKSYIPFVNGDKISQEIADSTNALVYGTFLVGLVEFFVAAIGFFAAGSNFYLLLATLVFFSAFIPMVGPGAIWIPVFLFFVFTGNYFSAVIVLLTGIVLSFGIDLIFRGRLLGRAVKINPLIMLVGIFGGIPAFGVFGFIIGPLILIYAIKILEEGLKG